MDLNTETLKSIFEAMRGSGVALLKHGDLVIQLEPRPFVEPGPVRPGDWKRGPDLTDGALWSE